MSHSTLRLVGENAQSRLEYISPSPELQELSPMKHALILGLVCSTLSACALRMEARPDEMRPPPPPFGPPSMSYEEAVQLGSRYASDRGYGYRLQEAHLIDGRYWNVNFRIFEHRSEEHTSELQSR